MREERDLLYNNIILTVLLLVQPYVIYMAYKVGKGEKVKPISIPHIKPKVKLTDKEIKEQTIWQNILNYDGTPQSQEEVK